MNSVTRSLAGGIGSRISSTFRHSAFKQLPRKFSTIQPTMVSKQAPDFTTNAVLPDNTIAPITLSSYIHDKYVCLFFWPYDFTFVCPSEIIAFNNAKEEFDKRNVQLLGASIDSTFTHLAWKRTPLDEGGIGNIDFPMLSDITKSISSQYGILHDDACALRGLFIIDKNGIMKHSLVNDLPLGRNVDEAIRIIDAIQHNEQWGEVCPANWKKGKKAMKATHEGVSDFLHENQATL